VSEADPILRNLQEIEWEVNRLQEDFEQRQAQADLVPLEDRDDAWKEARERRYLQYLEDMKALAAQYAAVRAKKQNDFLN
jgi:hypothetical protein